MPILDFAGRVIDPGSYIDAVKSGTVVGHASFAGMQVPIIRHGAAPTRGGNVGGRSGTGSRPRQSGAARRGGNTPEFREEAHPRGPDGKFRTTGGSGPAATDASPGNPRGAGAANPTRGPGAVPKTTAAIATAPSPPEHPLDRGTNHPAFNEAVLRSGQGNSRLSSQQLARDPRVRAEFDRIVSHPIHAAPTEDREASMRATGREYEGRMREIAPFAREVQTAYDRMAEQGRLPSRRRENLSRFLSNPASEGRKDHPAIAAAEAPEGSEARKRLDAAINSLAVATQNHPDAMREVGPPSQWATRRAVQDLYDRTPSGQEAEAAPEGAEAGGAWKARKVGQPPSRHLISRALPALSYMFGRPMSHEDLRDLVGAPKGSTINAHVSFWGTDPRVHIKFSGEMVRGGVPVKYSAERLVSFDPGSREIEISNEVFTCEQVDPKTGERSTGGRGLGLEVFAKQVETASALGVSEIKTYGARARGLYNGYYTWPQFGYDGRVPREEWWPEWAKSRRTFAELFRDEQGREFWRDHGVSVRLRFDLNPGGYSMQKLNEYRESRRRSANPSFAAG